MRGRPSAVDAQALAAVLGQLAFLDAEAIDNGDYFPSRLLDGLLNAHVVVSFATKAYSESHFCRLEMRLARPEQAHTCWSPVVLARRSWGCESISRAPLQRGLHRKRPEPE